MSSNPNIKPQKLPIPRLDRREGPSRPSADSSKSRVPRACLNCRSRKVKCNGARPSCKNCEDQGAQCVYSTSRKDRLKTATGHNQHLLALLKDLQHRVDGVDKARIEAALANATDDVADAAVVTGSGETPSIAPHEEKMDEERGEAHVSAEVGSNEDLDLVDEDLLRDPQSRATGFVGKTSEIQWLRRLDHETQSQGHDKYAGPYGPPGQSEKATFERVEAMKQRQEKDPAPLTETSSLNFYLDDQPVDLDCLVDSWELPPFAIAERLLNCYMTKVHDTFPIVAKKALVGRFYQYYASLGRGSTHKISQRWQGMLNIVFAIGAAYSHLAEEPWRADDRDHLVYHSRAWALTLKDPWWFSHPDLPQLQINGLLAFYYLAIGHVNRSWMVSGMAVRSGFALGLHLRNEDRSATAVKKEILRRVWWGLYSLESALSSLTGRPSVAFASHISIPLPLPLSTEEIDEAIITSRFGDLSKYPQSPEHLLADGNSFSTTNSIPRSTDSSNEPANSGSYLKATAKISMIMQKTLSVLYAADASSKSWEDAQKMIAELNEQLEIWSSSLPAGFTFNHQEVQPHYRDRIMLMFTYYSTRMMINRPCLCRLHRRIEHQSQSSHEFNRKTAETCVQSAKDLVNLLPDDPDINRSRIYHTGPWWSMVHSIMQALTVLLLELSYNVVGGQGHQAIVVSLSKLMQWLKAMSPTNTMAERAHNIAFALLRKLRPQLEIDISSLLEEDPSSPMHTYPHSEEASRMDDSDNASQSEPSEARERYNSYPQIRHTLQPNTYGFAADQMAFLGPSEFDTSASSSDYYVHSFPQYTSFTNLFVTPYDEQNPFPFQGGELIANQVGVPNQGQGQGQENRQGHYPRDMEG